MEKKKTHFDSHLPVQRRDILVARHLGTAFLNAMAQNQLIRRLRVVRHVPYASGAVAGTRSEQIGRGIPGTYENFGLVAAQFRGFAGRDLDGARVIARARSRLLLVYLHLRSVAPSVITADALVGRNNCEESIHSLGYLKWQDAWINSSLISLSPWNLL